MVGRENSETRGDVDASRRAEEQVQLRASPVLPTEEARPAQEGIDGWQWATVDTPETLAQFGQWLAEAGNTMEKTLVGICAASVAGAGDRATGIAFATKERGWLVSLTSDLMNPLLSSMFEALLSTKAAPVFISREMVNDVAVLSDLANLPPKEVAPLFVHDMQVLGRCTGRVVLARSDFTALQDALDCVGLGPMLAIDAPDFYQRVALPLIRLKAVPFLSSPRKNVTVVYDNLLLKVLTYFTHDPTLIGWFEDEETEPAAALTQLMGLSSYEELTAFLLWMCCNGDQSFFSMTYPELMQHLPENPAAIIVDSVDKKLPTLRLGLMEKTSQLAQQLTVTTLYDRVAPRGMSSNFYLHYVITGSVFDIVDVALASLLNVGVEDVEFASKARYTIFMRTAITGYSEHVDLETQKDLEELALLAHPLGFLSLDPKVTLV